jgi:chromosome partitioning protein
VDQSREWPYRDTAPGQDPAEARIDPIWGADPPDSARWHMDMTTDQATSGSGSPTGPTDSRDPAPPESEPGRDQQPFEGPASAGPATAVAPADALSSGQQGHSAGRSPAENEQAAGPRSDQASSLVGSPSVSAEEGPSSQGAASPVGWFATDASSFTGTISERLSANRPVDAPSPDQTVEAQAPSRDAAAGVELRLDAEGTVGPTGLPELGEGQASGGSGGPAGSQGPGGSLGSGDSGASGGGGPAGSPGPGGSAVAGRPAVAGGGPPAPEGTADDAVTAPHGAGTEPGQQGVRGPGLIEARMLYVDPDPEIGSSPATAERLERSHGPSSGTEPVPGGQQDAATDRPGTGASERFQAQAVESATAEVGAAAAPSTTATEPGQPSGISGQAPDVIGEPGTVTPAAEEPDDPITEFASEAGRSPSGVAAEGRTGAAAVGAAAVGSFGAGTETDASFDSTSADSAVGEAPWTEPALPGLPPGVPPSGSQAAAWRDEASPDAALVPRPDPSWPRLFGQRAGDQGSSDTGEAARPDDQAAAPVRDADPTHGERPGEQKGAQRDGAMPAPGRGVAGSPPPEEQASDTTQAAEVGATLSTGPGDGSASDQRPDPTASGGRGPSGVAVEHWEDPAAEEDAAVPTGSSLLGSDHIAIVDITTGDLEADRGPEVLQGSTGEADARPTPGSAAVHGGAHATEQANIPTVARTADVEEVDLQEASPDPSGDVSRETSAGGGEEMESGEEEVVEDEAALAVREAVSRAATQAGVDVSRETETPEGEVPVGGLVGEPSVDSEAAARNARVTFRIHREMPNGTRRVMAVANQKGGVGKSTTAVNIGSYLALAGARVLVVDLDPQGNASTGLGLDHREIEPSIYDVLTGEAPASAAIRATSVANLHVLPSTIDLAGAEVELVSAMSRETRLRRALESVDHQYDAVLIDCPPSLGLLTVNALAAANELLIPIQCEYYALEGLGQLLRNVELVRANLNPELRIGGIVLTMYDGRTRLALQVVEEVRKHFTDIVYQTVVPRSVRLSEAPGYGVPIALYDPLSRGGIAYRDLTFELAERTGLLAPTGEGAS